MARIYLSKWYKCCFVNEHEIITFISGLLEPNKTEMTKKIVSWKSFIIQD